MQRIGIMQGRLTPPSVGRFQCFPRNDWRAEFPRAAEAGLAAIEWIFDEYGEDANPIVTEAGIAAVKAESQRWGIDVASLCADWFMDRPLVRIGPAERTERLEKLAWLLRRCQLLGVGRVVLPFVDVSRIDSEQDFEDVVSGLRAVLPVAEETGVEVHLETSLPPSRFAALLARLEHPLVKANYDSGNSASLGYDVREEFAAYGGRVGSVHVKDRVRGGGTVPLGTGHVDFPAFFDCLKQIRYGRDLILQVARGVPGEEVRWARENCAFVARYLRAVGGEAA
jgi:hexulose-6-phosphate isomerase